MKAAKVRLYIRIRHTDGRDVYANPAWNRNRTLREGYASVDGKQEHHPEGTYYLRYKRGNKRVWESVGRRSDLALVANRNVEHDLQAQALGRSDKVAATDRPELANREEPVLLTDAKAAYVKEIRAHRLPKTISSCENILDRFEKTVPGKTIADIHRDDLLSHMVRLKSEGLAVRTIFNHLARINSFLIANARPDLLRAADWPKYEEKEVRSYHDEEVTALLNACGPRDRLLFEFFLGSGLREQEVMYATWANIDFRDKLISVFSKPEWGFRVKDKEERSVPIPDLLVDSLREWKRISEAALIFPSKTGERDGHFLRQLKSSLPCRFELWRMCDTKRLGMREARQLRRMGPAQISQDICHNAFGSECPPAHHTSMVRSRKLDTTLAYLALADVRSEKTRKQVNTTFSGLLVARAA